MYRPPWSCGLWSAVLWVKSTYREGYVLCVEDSKPITPTPPVAYVAGLVVYSRL